MEPMLPPMNSNAIAATTARCPPIAPCATRIASDSPVRSRASVSRSPYRLLSRKCNGSGGARGSSIRVYPTPISAGPAAAASPATGSNVNASRSAAVTRI
ncbi:MAG: hypothetical protein NVS2B11_00220 [Acetobacteraceae bacterium]